MLDDVFSVLDGKTGESIFQAMFSKQGLARRLDATGILASNVGEMTSYQDLELDY